MRWRVIQSFPDYEISDCGDVRRTTKPKAGSAASRTLPYLLKPAFDRKGYRFFSLTNRQGKRRTVRPCREVLTAFVAPPPFADAQAAHIDGTKTNDRLENLYWASPKQNAQDRVRHGTYARGSDSFKALLNEKQVRAIKRIYTPRHKRRGLVGIARRLGVSPSTINSIIIGKNWTHVTG